MTYLFDRTKKRKQNMRRLVLVVSFLLCIVFWTTIRGGINAAVTPVVIVYGDIKLFFSFTPEFITTYFSTRTSLLSEKKLLEENNRRLENELAEKNILLTEAQARKDFVVDRDNTENHSVIVAYPLLQDITNIYSTILLSKGFKDGVEVGDRVYLSGLKPVCIVQEVYTRTSLCQLLSAAGNMIDANIVTASTTVSLTLTGRGGGVFLGDVPRNTEITAESHVYLKSDPTMMLGTVSSMLHNDQDTSWKVFVRGFYNPSATTVLYIRK